MEIDLPNINKLKKIKLRLEIPIISNHNKKLSYYPNESIIGNWSGVYIIEKNNKIIYVGTTNNLRNRMFAYTKIADYVYFYPEENSSQQIMIEAIYKYKIFGKYKITGWKQT